MTRSARACDGRRDGLEAAIEGEGDATSGDSIVADARPKAGLRRAAGLGLFACAGSIALLAMQALAAGRLELTFDEAYYTLWSRALAFGYLDHPPMVAVLIRASTALFGGSELGVRALSLLLVGALPGADRLHRLAAVPFGRDGRARRPDVDRHAARHGGRGVRDARRAARRVLDAGARGARRALADRQGALAARDRRRARPRAAVEIHRRLFRRRRRPRLPDDAVAAALARLARCPARRSRSPRRSSPRSSSGTPSTAGRPSSSSSAARRRTGSRRTISSNSSSRRSGS